MSGEVEQEQLAELAGVRPRLATLEPPAITADVEATAFVASPWQLMWWKFRKHKLAMIGCAGRLVHPRPNPGTRVTGLPNNRAG